MLGSEDRHVLRHKELERDVAMMRGQPEMREQRRRSDVHERRKAKGLVIWVGRRP